MTARTGVLDIPDEEPRNLRGWPAAVLGALVWIALGVVAARTFALGGTVRPWLVIGSILAIPAMVIAWVLAGPHRFRNGIAAGAMVVALLAQPIAASGATPSPARLAQMANSFGLPGETVRDVRIGNGRCSPSCSELRRTTVAKGLAYAKVRSQVAGIMRAYRFDVKVYGNRAGEPLRIDAASDDLLVSFEIRYVDAAETRIASVWIARGPKSDNEVG